MCGLDRLSLDHCPHCSRVSDQPTPFVLTLLAPGGLPPAPIGEDVSLGATIAVVDQPEVTTPHLSEIETSTFARKRTQPSKYKVDSPARLKAETTDWIIRPFVARRVLQSHDGAHQQTGSCGAQASLGRRRCMLTAILSRGAPKENAIPALADHRNGDRKAIIWGDRPLLRAFAYFLTTLVERRILGGEARSLFCALLDGRQLSIAGTEMLFFYSHALVAAA
jgi:hypothetical protein